MRRWLITIAGLLAAGATTVGVVSIVGSEDTATFCPADGRLDYPDARRDPSRGCAWVDEDGNLIPEFSGQ